MPGLSTQLPPPGPKQVIAAAKVGGGAATLATDPTVVNAPFVKVSAVATAADSITLPFTNGGDTIVIQNQGAASMTVWGWGGATINGGASLAHANGLAAMYVSTLEGTWARFLQG
jgi:hypothetical protein